jgi:hypothetical protein
LVLPKDDADVGAGLCHHERDALADAATGAGNQHLLPLRSYSGSGTARLRLSRQRRSPGGLLPRFGLALAHEDGHAHEVAYSDAASARSFCATWSLLP